MKFKNQIRRLFNKKAGASVGVAIKVLTSVVLGAAMLAGTYGIVKTNVVPTAENKVSSMFEATDTITLDGGGSGGVVIPDPVVELKRNGVIPEGGTYAVKATSTVLSSGDNFPETPATGDIYEEGDYKYTYSNSYWKVIVKDKSKSTYGEIFSEIAGKSVTDMTETFGDCASLTTAPVIPNSVINMDSTFYSCTSLTTAPTIPDSVTNMEYTFWGCISLTTAPAIPSSVTNMSHTFWKCTSLVNPPDISNASSVINMSCTFHSCMSLTTAPVIPNSVTDMSLTFYECTSLTTAPVIPSSVRNMQSTFYGCKFLTGTIEINANNLSGPTNHDYCFYNTIKPITLTGSSPHLELLVNTANKGNVTVA